MSSVTAITDHLGWDFTDPREVRRRARIGEHTGQTGALAPGFVQANLAILPRDYADEFVAILPAESEALSATGSFRARRSYLARVGGGFGYSYRCTELSYFSPRRAYRRCHGHSFVMARRLCRIRHGMFILVRRTPHRGWAAPAALGRWQHRLDVLLTNIDCAPAGRFHGKMVTSMRPFTPSDVIKAVQITSRYPSVHGAPVHIGLPEMVGIEDVSKAWQGDDPVIGDDELPVFWACGVTPQSVVRSARPPICITHTPASMLVTDLRNASLSVG